MKTRGQLEAEISDALTKFEKDYMGRGPTETRTHIFDDIVLVRLRGVLTPAEQQLVQAENPAEGRRLVKRMRMELLENAYALLKAVISEITGRSVVSMHTDISTTTGERVIIFVLDSSLDAVGQRSIS
ncbi:MAG: Na-translocating system protein MpsC family protein [Armatimonadota bacterium]